MRCHSHLPDCHLAFRSLAYHLAWLATKVTQLRRPRPRTRLIRRLMRLRGAAVVIQLEVHPPRTLHDRIRSLTRRLHQRLQQLVQVVSMASSILRPLHNSRRTADPQHRAPTVGHMPMPVPARMVLGRPVPTQHIPHRASSRTLLRPRSHSLRHHLTARPRLSHTRTKVRQTMLQRLIRLDVTQSEFIQTLFGSLKRIGTFILSSVRAPRSKRRWTMRSELA